MANIRTIYNLELNQEELNTLVIAFGETNDTEREHIAKKKKVNILESIDALNLYEQLLQHVK